MTHACTAKSALYVTSNIFPLRHSRLVVRREICGIEGVAKLLLNRYASRTEAIHVYSRTHIS